MSTVTFDFHKTIKPMKPMHAVNNGPIPWKKDQSRGNFEEYKAARIPYARNHDAAFFSTYGGEHIVDVHAIFPDFAADENDPNNYDFTLTDIYTKNILDAGTKVFYRLGSKIEHAIKKYGTIMPSDFHKWARICEHIILHYNEGWADGFHYNIEYWEIWNEPDLDEDDADNKRNWSGTAQDYYELYEISATYLKEKFPHLKIGGPALAFRTGDWLDNFLNHLTKDGKHVPMDFFSWHAYSDDPKHIGNMHRTIREKLDKAGYKTSESILNEWNYVEGWTDLFVHTIEMIISMRGAAFTLAAMCDGQKAGIDMMMYYDARPCAFNGMFDFYTFRPLKGYYVFPMFADLYELGTETGADSDDEDFYTLSAANDTGTAAVLCYVPKTGKEEEKTVTIQLKNAKSAPFSIFLLDESHTMEPMNTNPTNHTFTLTLKANSVVFLKQ